MTMLNQTRVSSHDVEQPTEDIVQLDDTVPALESSKGCKRNQIYTVLFLVLTTTTTLALIFLITSNKDGQIKDDVPYEERLRYYQELQEIFQPIIESPQDQAIEWLAFQDDPLQGEERNFRLWQRFALVVLYFAHGGPNTWNLFNQAPNGWIQNGAGVHECGWRGIDCNSEKEITGIRLSGDEGITLTGEELTTELGVLSKLRYLDLSDNRLQGTITPDWSSLVAMEVLDLSNNVLRSSIPSYFGDFANLKSLSLGRNQFTGDYTIQSKSLEYLDLQSNSGIAGRLDEILASIPNLKHLDVSLTMVSGTIPAQSLSNLEVLKLWGTEVTGTLPTEIGTWTNLQTLNLHDLQGMVGTLPTQLGLLTNLESLILGYASNLQGNLPSELGLLTNLVEMDLKFTSREGNLPTEYGQLSNLMLFDVSFNEGITGTIPSEYANWSNIKLIFVDGTNLRGTVGAKICDLDFVQFWADCKEDELVCSCCTQCKK